MKVIFFGTPEFVIPILESLLDTSEVVGIVTMPDKPTGRKKILTPSPVKQAAPVKGISTVFTPTQFTDEIITKLQSLSPDIFVTAAYGKIIPDDVLSIPPLGALNIHPSLLPKYRGPSPIQTAIINGDTKTGISFMKMDEKMDHGPLLFQEEVKLHGNETFASLHVSLFKQAASILPTVIKHYASGRVQPTEQNHAEATYCQLIKKEDGYFSVDNPPEAEILDRMIRAYYPWPTAWSKLQMGDGTQRVIKFLPEGRIQLEGGKPMTIKDLLNGHPELREIIEKLGLMTND